MQSKLCAGSRLVCSEELLRRMRASDAAQHLIICRLRIYADAGHTPALCRTQLVVGYRVGSARLERELAQPRQIDILTYAAEQTVELLAAERRRRSAAYIYGIDPSADPRQQSAERAYITAQPLEIIGNERKQTRS